MPAPEPPTYRRPTAWLFRALPGFGYSFDRDVPCQIQGAATVGGWYIGKLVTPSLLVGGGLVVGLSGLPDDGCVTDDSGARIAIGAVIGPAINWYPLDAGLFVSAMAGYATYDQDSMHVTHGVGSTIALGYDWDDGPFKSGGRSRFGLALQVTVARMTSGHAMMTPALVLSAGAD
ncbi:MAG TPA: hypothetical protein VIV11_21635 [Kofleriaceae bacterium]